MLTRSIERLCIGATLLVFFIMLMYTNGSVRSGTRADNGKYSHLDHRITALRHRIDKAEEANVVVKPAAEEKAAAEPTVPVEATPKSEPSAFDDYSAFATG